MRRGAVAVTAMVVALGAAPAAARATVTSSTIATWTSSEPGTPPDASYLISDDNPRTPPDPAYPTKLTVSGQTNGVLGDHVDVVCFYGSPSQDQGKVLASGLAVHEDGSFTTPTGSLAPALKTIAGHACRLRAVPAGADGTSTDVSNFAGPDLAVSQVALPSASVDRHPYDFYSIGTTLTAYAGWGSAGSCGPYMAPLDPWYGMGNFALDCVGSLLGANLPGHGTRSEVQVDGQDAYDAASAQAVFGGLEDLTSNFPSLTANLQADPSDGLMASKSTEGWVVCAAQVIYPPTSSDCPHFTPAGVALDRSIATSHGGQVVTMTDTWSSTDGHPHSLDLLYDDYIGRKSSSAQPGYEFPGQSTFSAYGQGTTLPGPGGAFGSILVRSNLDAVDGDTSEAAGAITFSTAPSSFAFVSDKEFAEHQVLQVPAGGSASLTYVYSTAYTVAQVQALALAAQDRFQPPTIAIASPSDGTTVSSPTESVTGTASAGSGISSVSVSGETVPVEPAGEWSAQVALSPGSNTITAHATDGAGATVQAQVTVIYQPPPSMPGPPAGPGSATSPGPGPTPRQVCKVPRIEGMKLPAAKRALRHAHCRVGRIRHRHSKKVRAGRVLATSPGAGRRMAAGSRVELFLSEGR
jgi:hypothetical protein